MFCFRTHATIQEIKKKFREQFPFLKIEILGDHTFGNGNEFQEMNSLSHEKRKPEKLVSIFPVHSVKEVELTLQKELKLPVRIFRKNKDEWMETQHSYYLSLETQNEMGRLSEAGCREEGKQ